MEEDDRPQIDKFREMAKQLECDDDEAAFDARLRRLAPKPVAKGDKPAD